MHRSSLPSLGWTTELEKQCESEADYREVAKFGLSKQFPFSKSPCGSAQVMPIAPAQQNHTLRSWSQGSTGTRSWMYRWFYMEGKNTPTHPFNSSAVRRQQSPWPFFGHWTAVHTSADTYTYRYVCIQLRGNHVTDGTCLAEKWKEQNQRDLQQDLSVEQHVAPHSYLKMLSCPPACL